MDNSWAISLLPMLSLNEIRALAYSFAQDFAHEVSEDAEAKSFWDSFFAVFGIARRRVAGYHKPSLIGYLIYYLA